MRGLRRGAGLTRKTARLVLDEPKLALFPTLSTLFTALAAALVFGASHRVGFAPRSWHLLVLLAILSYPLNVAGTFFGVAFAAMAACRLDGEPVTVRAGIGCARRRIRSIAGWAALSTGVGLGLAALRQMRGGWLATRAASWLLGLVWVVATFFAVPLLALEDTGPVETVRRSASLVRRRWGEGVTDATSMASVAGLLLVPIYVLFVGTGVVFAASPPAGLAMLVCALLALLAAFSFLTALNQGFRVVLYRYATTGRVDRPFTQVELEHAFRPRRKPRLRSLLRRRSA